MNPIQGTFRLFSRGAFHTSPSLGSCKSSRGIGIHPCGAGSGPSPCQCFGWLQVQSGVGRTGKWWGHEHMEGVDADIMTFAKGIGSGFPMAGVATRHNLFDGIAPGTLVRPPPPPPPPPPLQHHQLQRFPCFQVRTLLSSFFLTNTGGDCRLACGFRDKRLPAYIFICILTSNNALCRWPCVRMSIFPMLPSEMQKLRDRTHLRLQKCCAGDAGGAPLTCTVLWSWVRPRWRLGGARP